MRFGVTVSVVFGSSGLKVRCGYETLWPSSPVIVTSGADSGTSTAFGASSVTTSASFSLYSAIILAYLCPSDSSA